ncbi:MAG TPA: class I adenylate-forming enzyme family protein [Luteolibacter sp.]
MNIFDEIAARADRERTAVVVEGARVTFGELLTRAEAVAAWLKATPGFVSQGVPRIGLACDNGLDHIVLALGILKAGGCLVPVADELTEAERAEVIERTGLHGVVIGARETWRPGEEAGGRETSTQACWVPLSTPPFEHEEKFAALSPAFIRFSSGTTGRSKGVVLSHRTLLDRITTANQVLQIGPDDRVLWMLPMAHHFAVSIVLYLYFGACTVVGGSHLAADVLALAEKEQATVIYGAPFHHALLAADRGNFRWPTLRLAVSTAAALTRATAEAFRVRYDRPLVQGMGIIEVGLPLMNIGGAIDSPEAVGEPVPGFEVDLRAGELWLRGPGMFDAYVSPWQPAAEVKRDGWFATGDLAERDASGKIFLRGRTKSVFNVGGMKVFPEEVEAVLDRHPSVRRSRVIGREHPILGTVPVAEIVAANGNLSPGELKAWCRESLSAYKVPVAFKQVDAVPLTASGKVRRG